MPKHLADRVFFGLVLALGGMFPAAGQSPQPAAPQDGRPAAARQDGRQIARLEWVSPRGELPGTYADYMLRRPLTDARFGPLWEYAARASVRADALAILVDADLYPDVAPALSSYVARLTAAGHQVQLATVSGGTPAQIKAWIRQRWAQGAHGILLVGDITAAWVEVSGDVFPSDLYYMDLDGLWLDNDLDGDFEIHEAGPGDEGPEAYVARLHALTLIYDTEANLVNGYLNKVQGYCGSVLDQPWRGLEYVDEDWFDMAVHLALLYDDVTRFDSGYDTTADDYLAQMAAGRHFVQVCAHSYSGGHHFGRRPTESAAYAHVYVHSPIQRPVRLRFGSDDGLKVWLNGAVVLNQDVYQGWIADQFFATATLQAGWNQLLCKVSQGGGAYQFSAQVSSSTYQPIPDLSYQLNDPDTHGAEAPFIRGWLVNGFHQDTSDRFWYYLTTNYLGVNEASVNPQPGDVHGGKTWTTLGGSGPYIDLDAYGGGADYGATYAFARVTAAAAVSCQLWLGYDDGARVWLNGQQVLMDNRYGGYTTDMTKVPVTLNAGENRLLVKVSEWMGTHGFSARFCYADGTGVPGLTFDPAWPTITYIGTWLMNGPYYNPDQATRLSHDYLGGEATVRPSAGSGAPVPWAAAFVNPYPVDLGQYYDTDGGWVFSDTVQQHDPPVLFYNLFACGPGRFTDENYLAGAYIFNTTWGLITVASSKSGSMLNFQDFTGPLGQGKNIGTAFREWFDAQAPYELWEREWYYGMVLCGDPTLRPTRAILPGDLNCDGTVDFGDINPFVLVLTAPGAWLAAHPGCSYYNGDLNFDGAVDFGDINPFVALLSGL